MKVRTLSYLVLFVAFGFIVLSHADEEELAKQTQNPLADLISVPFQNNIGFNLGPHDRTQNVLNIQPIIPFNLTDNWNLITRTIVPVIYQPDVLSNSGGELASDTAMATRCCSPPERRSWVCPRRSFRPTNSNSSTARFLRSSVSEILT